MGNEVVFKLDKWFIKDDLKVTLGSFIAFFLKLQKLEVDPGITLLLLVWGKAKLYLAEF